MEYGVLSTVENKNARTQRGTQRAILSTGYSSYAELRDKVRKTLLEGQRKIELAKVQTYWDTGKHINEHLRIHEGRTEYKKKTLIRLGKDLDLDDSVLRRCAELKEGFPDLPIRAGWHKSGNNRIISIKKYPWACLHWSHFRALLPLEDLKTRYELADQAAEKGWIAEELEAKVRKINEDIREKNGGGGKHPVRPSELLTPKLGKTGIYQMIQDGDSLTVDLGFTSYCKLPKNQASKFKAGDYCLWKGDAPPKKIQGAPSDLFTYEAEVLKVVDGDTLWLKIWLADDLWLKEKVRLRGINCPEMDTREGKDAKKFVESVIASSAKQSRILIATTKPDKYDRYLTDVFLPISMEQRARSIENKSLNSMPSALSSMLFLNNELLKHGLAEKKTNYSFSDWGDLER
ncbi:MAG: DUF1016 family protein [Candidatus Omnitrophica bacterium]|nr:DUF1016 family protein [Candidatus Omnitrophota bacterium]